MEQDYKSLWNEATKLNVWLLRMAGILLPKQTTYALNFYTVATGIILIPFVLVNFICQLMELFFIYDDITALTGSVYLFLAEFMFIIKVISFITHADSLQELMELRNADLFQTRNPAHIAIMTPNLKFWKFIYNANMMACIASNLFWVMFPLLDTTGKRKLPFLAWYPYDSSVSPFYEIMYFHQSVTYTYVCFTHLNIDMIISAFNVYLAGQLDILGENLKYINGERFDVELKKCIKHHQLILRFSEHCNKLSKSIILFEFPVIAIIMGMTMFQMTIMIPFTVQFFSFTSFGMAAILQIFVYCWFGNEVQIKSKNLPWAAFQSDWVAAAKPVKMNIYFFIMRSQKPVRSTAFNFLELSLDSFKAILKTTWSYFTLLNQVNRR